MGEISAKSGRNVAVTLRSLDLLDPFKFESALMLRYIAAYNVMPTFRSDKGELKLENRDFLCEGHGSDI